MTLQPPDELAVLDTPWVVLADARHPLRPGQQRPAWWVYGQVAVLTLVALLVVGAVAAALSVQRARDEAAVAATQRSRVLADTVVAPSIADDITSGRPGSTKVLDDAVRRFVLTDGVVRVKLWSADGRIVYSDEPGLVAGRYLLAPDQRAVLLSGAEAEAHVSDPTAPENRFEAGYGKLLEVYSHVETPSGEPLLFETYYRYSTANSRVGDIWRGIVTVAFASTLLLLVLLLPVIWRLVVRLRRTQEQRELLLVRAAENSAVERRRIAATLHDGVVQDLAATAFVLAGASGSAERAAQPGLAANLRQAGDAVRSSIGGLRSLLVEIYPPSLNASGLEAVLTDLVAGPDVRDLDVRLELPEASRTRLDREGERLVFRAAQECLRTVSRHAGAQHVVVRLADTGRSMVLTVTDDGLGFDLDALLQGDDPDGHSLRLLVEEAQRAGADLRVRSAPGGGTQWELRVRGR